MGGGTATAYLLWAILAVMFLIFLLLHLWNYDRFHCLRWNAGRQPGAFKRVMTYSYLASVPLVVAFTVSITALKFKEGFIVSPEGHIFPRPFSLWDSVSQRWAVPLFFTISIAWSLELITHLEELTFWIFLLNQGPSKRDWFDSWEFQIWTIGSTGALLVMPITVLITRRGIDTCLAYVFLVGSTAGTFTTILFLYVLARFPGFIRHVKEEGAEPEVVHRLSTFYALNRIRVLFRFLFTLPLLLMGADGIVAPHIIAKNLFATDFLLMLGGIGSLVSSGITLLIFFPRPFTRDLQNRTKSHPTRTKTPPPAPQYHDEPNLSSPKSTYASERRMDSYRFAHAISAPSFDLSPYPSEPTQRRNSNSSDISPIYEIENVGPLSQPSPPPPPPQLRHPRPMPTTSSVAPSSNDTVFEREREQEAYVRTRRYSDGHVIFDRRAQPQPLTGSSWASDDGRRNAVSPRLHPYVVNFTSPIDLMDEGNDNEMEYGHQPA